MPWYRNAQEPVHFLPIDTATMTMTIAETLPLERRRNAGFWDHLVATTSHITHPRLSCRSSPKCECLCRLAFRLGVATPTSEWRSLSVNQADEAGGWKVDGAEGQVLRFYKRSVALLGGRRGLEP